MTYTMDCNRTVIDLFEAQVLSNPTLLALKDKNSEYTFATLNEKANQVALGFVFDISKSFKNNETIITITV